MIFSHIRISANFFLKEDSLNHSKYLLCETFSPSIHKSSLVIVNVSRLKTGMSDVV